MSGISEISESPDTLMQNYNQLLKNVIDNFTKTIEYFGDKHTMHSIELQNFTNEMQRYSNDLYEVLCESNRISNEIIELKSQVKSLSASLDEIKQMLNTVDSRSNKNIINIDSCKEEIEKCKKQQQKSFDYTNRRLNEVEQKRKRYNCCVVC